MAEHVKQWGSDLHKSIDVTEDGHTPHLKRGPSFKGTGGNENSQLNNLSGNLTNHFEP